jgi:hydroxyacylglutathione hydrolase
MFEGTPQQFWDSLSRLKALPARTQLYCAHEYTQSNARFAVHADPENDALADYAAAVDAARSAGRATVPFVLERELETNPFLRADDSALAERWGAEMPWRCSLRSERPRTRFKKEGRCEGLPLALPERLPTIR